MESGNKYAEVCLIEAKLRHVQVARVVMTIYEVFLFFFLFLMHTGGIPSIAVSLVAVLGGMLLVTNYLNYFALEESLDIPNSGWIFWPIIRRFIQSRTRSEVDVSCSAPQEQVPSDLYQRR